MLGLHPMYWFVGACCYAARKPKKRRPTTTPPPPPGEPPDSTVPPGTPPPRGPGSFTAQLGPRANPYHRRNHRLSGLKRRF